MGVKGFFQLFEGTEAKLKPSKKDTDVVPLEGTSAAVDTMTELYRSALGTPKLGTLTNSKGEPSAHINIMLQLALKFQKADVDQIYVFDAKVPPELKLAELAKRRVCKDDAIALGQEKRSFQVTDKMIEDIKYIFRCIGVKYIDAPDGYDAEHICALMNKEGSVEYVISSDADVFLYGGDAVLKHEKRKLMLYTREDLLNTTGLKDEQVVLLGLHLGCDFCQKTKGVGIKTVVKKCVSLPLTEEQEAAKEQLLSKPVWDKPTIYEENREELAQWLISEWDFNSDRVKKMLNID